MLFPGLDLHTRCRYKNLPQFFLAGGNITTLDAGCGNGCLSYAAYKKGNKVIGISFDKDAIQRCKEFYKSLNIDANKLDFQVINLYDIEAIGCKFDQIICSETLEHISDDKRIIESFYKLLNANGILHLCCPYSLHPEHCKGRVNEPEDGGHVRDGYTLESYKKLLEPAGFEIIECIGLGSPIIVQLDNFIRFLTSKAGEAVALPFFLLTYPLQLFDYLNPKLPFSLYVQAIKK